MKEEDIKLKLLLLSKMITPNKNGGPDLEKILENFQTLVQSYNKQILIK